MKIRIAVPPLAHADLPTASRDELAWLADAMLDLQT